MNLGKVGVGLALALVSVPSAYAYEVLESFDQAEERDATGKITVEASTIHVVACDDAGENGGQYYVYEYMKRPGFRAIRPPEWGSPIGGRDFATQDEAIVAACFAGMPQRPEPVGPARDATPWRGQNGKRVLVTCAPGFALASIWGTDVYTDDSDICTAAVHAGTLTQVEGGDVVIEIRPGQAEYPGTARNNVTTANWGQWHGSFVIVGTGPS